MRAASKDSGEWVDGFLFVGNRLILDFLNTRPVLAQGPTELLTDFDALGRWCIASGIVNSVKTKGLFRQWRGKVESTAFLKELLAFRERLREAVMRIEGGSTPSDDFIKELNAQLLEYPPQATLRKRNGRVVRETIFHLQKPADLWAPIIHGAADLLTESDTRRLRQCESCVVHFYDMSKKSSRRWCSMNICGNRIKVAAYQHRKRYSDSR
jgi:predicted RNA-binding Zn ribbon-like protein